MISSAIDTVPHGNPVIDASRGTSEREKKSNLTQLRILIAEDNHINQKIIAALLAPLDCQIDVVENGLEAVAAVAQSKYNLVLMDINMPQMDGMTSAREIRKLTDSTVSDIPIIAVTANASAEESAQFYEAGMNDFVPKPIKQSDLLKAITRCTNVLMPELEETPSQGTPGGNESDEDLKDGATKAITDELNNLIGDLDNLIDQTTH